jgi:hypothetical protein
MCKWIQNETVAVMVSLFTLVTLGATATFAQGPTDNGAPRSGHAQQPMETATPAPAHVQELDAGNVTQNAVVAIAARVMGMEQAALQAELNTGKSIAEVAQARNVSIDTIANALVEPRAAELRAAVAAKQLTQAQADAALAEMKERVIATLLAKTAPRSNVQEPGQVDANKGGAFGLRDNGNANRAPLSYSPIPGNPHLP